MRATEEQIAKAFKEVFGKDSLKDFGFYTEAKYTPPDTGRAIATRAILTFISSNWKPFKPNGSKGPLDEVSALMDGTSTSAVLMLGVAVEIKSDILYSIGSRELDKTMFATVCEIADWDLIAEHYLQAVKTHRNANKVFRSEVEKPMMRPLQPGDTVSFPETSGVVANEKMPF